MTKEQIVEANKNLVYKIAGEFYGAEAEDLYNAGVVGLLKAYNSYKDDGYTKFSTYAYRWIYGEMYLIASQKQLKVSRDILRSYKWLESERYKIAQVLGYVPSNFELANYLEIPTSKVEEVLMCAHQVISLDAETTESKDLHEVIPNQMETNVDDRLYLEVGLNELDPLDRSIVTKSHFEDKTQSEIAKELKLTQVMVSRRLNKSYEQMKNYMSL